MTRQELETKFDQFLEDNNGKYISLLNPGRQCFDLVVAFTDLLGVPHFPGNPSPFPYVNASDIYNKFMVFQAQYFDRIPNSDTFVPQKGDIGVYDGGLNGGVGDVFICTGEGDTNTFKGFNQNWVLGSPAQLITHNYNYFLGVLRLKVTTQPMTLPTELQTYSLAWKDLAIKDQLDVNSDLFKQYRFLDLQISMLMKNTTDPLEAQIISLQGTNSLLTSKIDVSTKTEKALNDEVEAITYKLSEQDVVIQTAKDKYDELKSESDASLAECQKECQVLKDKQPIIKVVEVPVVSPKVYKNHFARFLQTVSNILG